MTRWNAPFCFLIHRDVSQLASCSCGHSCGSYHAPFMRWTASSNHDPNSLLTATRKLADAEPS